MDGKSSRRRTYYIKNNGSSSQQKNKVIYLIFIKNIIYWNIYMFKLIMCIVVNACHAK